MRGINSALATEASSNHIRLIVFVKIELDSGTIYLHNGVGTYTWSDPDDGSQSWLGMGDFGGISGVEESTKMSPFEIQMVLSGLDTSMMTEILDNHYFYRPVTIYFGAINQTTGVLVADPDEFWSGFIDTADLSLGSENAIMITCESELSIFRKRNASVYSDSDLQDENPGDLWFKWLAAMSNAKVVWRGYNTIGEANPDPSPQTPGQGYTPYE